MSNRAKDWFIQAEKDLSQASDSRNAGRHEWANVKNRFAKDAVWLTE